MLPSRGIALGAPLVLIVAGWLSIGPPGGRHAEGDAVVDRIPDPSIAVPPDTRPVARDERRIAGPASLAGTDVDGALDVDAAGDFAPGPRALRLFDYFLSATGEEPPDAIRARIVVAIFERLPGPAAEQAVALLDRYLSYRDDAQRLAASGAAPQDLERGMQWLRELRREHFGAELAGALFAEEEEVSLIDLEQRRIRVDTGLSDAERVARIEELDSRLPAAVREARRSSVEPARVHQQVAALREAGADASEVFAERERAFGRAAAERLAALDEERALWQGRLDRYAEHRAAILADGRLSAAEQREAIAALRARSFEGGELIRVRLLDEAR